MSSILFVLLLFTSALTVIKTVHRNSYLLDPKGDFRSFKKAECRLGGPSQTSNDSCAGPCISKSSWQYDPHAKTTTHHRDQQVRLTWPRDNHMGGFVRITIISQRLRMDRSAHAELAFHSSCYEAGASFCKHQECGTDGNKIVLSTQILIPTIYPDGDYALGRSWFGGVSFENDSFFGGY